jgi:hypothetical protein
MKDEAKGYIAGLKGADAIVKGILDNVAGEHSSAARIERQLLRSIRRDLKAAIQVSKGGNDATL